VKISRWILLAVGVVVVGAAIGGLVVWRALQRGYWVPAPANTFLVQTTRPLDVTSPTDLGDGDYTYRGTPALPPDVYLIDGNTNTSDTVDALHARGAHVVCQVPFQTWNPAIYDAGNPGWAQLEGRPAGGGARWIDTNPKGPNFHTLLTLMTTEFENCRQLGFDAVASDGVTAPSPAEATFAGVPTSDAATAIYMEDLVAIAHSVGLSIGQTDGMSAAPQLAPHYDFAVVHDCVPRGTCALSAPYATARKAIFDIETSTAPARFCTAAGAAGRSAGRYNPALDGKLRIPCA
jgi:hypothetical protein